jgi:hypothetical protein
MARWAGAHREVLVPQQSRAPLQRTVASRDIKSQLPPDFGSNAAAQVQLDTSNVGYQNDPGNVNVGYQNDWSKHNAPGYQKSPNSIGYQKSPNSIGYQKSPNSIGYQKSPNSIGYQKSPNSIGYQKTPAKVAYNTLADLRNGHSAVAASFDPKDQPKR